MSEGLKNPKWVPRWSQQKDLSHFLQRNQLYERFYTPTFMYNLYNFKYNCVSVLTFRYLYFSFDFSTFPFQFWLFDTSTFVLTFRYFYFRFDFLIILLQVCFFNISILVLTFQYFISVLTLLFEMSNSLNWNRNIEQQNLK